VKQPDGVAGFACVSAAWAAHEGELRGFLRHRLADPAQADDLLQDVFIKAMRQGHGFCTLDNPRAWLFQVARNVLVDHARRSRPALAIDEVADTLAAPADEPPPAVDALTDCLARVLDELTPEDADILRACDLQGQVVRAYAQAQGLGLPAAKSRLLRARHRLRDRMTAACQLRFDDDGRVASHVPRSLPGEP
jgi:RNA polymerase sigma-70 factor (ECF subfamily)